MMDGKANKDGRGNLMVAGRINKDGKANLLMVGDRGNKNSNINLLKGGKVNRCSRSPSSNILLNYQRDLREIADNKRRIEVGCNQ